MFLDVGFNYFHRLKKSLFKNVKNIYILDYDKLSKIISFLFIYLCIQSHKTQFGIGVYSKNVKNKCVSSTWEAELIAIEKVIMKVWIQNHIIVGSKSAI